MTRDGVLGAEHGAQEQRGAELLSPAATPLQVGCRGVQLVPLGTCVDGLSIMLLLMEPAQNTSLSY